MGSPVTPIAPTSSLGEANFRTVALHASAAAAPVASRCVALDGLVKIDRKQLPNRVRLFGPGDNPTRAGIVVKVGEKTRAVLMQMQQLTGCDDVALDYEHSSHKDHPNFKGEPCVVAGYGRIELTPTDEVFYTGIDYTASGKEFALNYKDLSPVVHTDDEGNLLWISSVALTRHGATPGAHFFSTGGLARPLNIDRNSLLEMLSLPEEATDDDINSAVSKLLSDMKNDPSAAAGTTTAKPEATPAPATALSVDQMAQIGQLISTAVTAAVTPLTAELKALKDANGAVERNAIVAEAAAAGKKIPAFALSGDAALSNPQLRALVADLQAGAVPLSADGQTVTPGAAAGEMTPAEKAMCRALNLTEEQWKKYNSDGSPKAV